MALRMRLFRLFLLLAEALASRRWPVRPAGRAGEPGGHPAAVAS